MKTGTLVKHGAGICSVAMILSACGGGGSKLEVDASMLPVEVTSRLRNIADALSGDRQEEIGNKAALAARNTPRFGSVTQSSNAVGNVTADSVEVDVTRGSGGVTYRLSGSLGGDESFSFGGTVDPDGGGRSENRAELRDDLQDGRLYVRVRTRFAGDTQNTDYLAAGYWAFLPDDRSDTDNLSFGAFADGTDPFPQDNLSALVGTASYAGGAGGVFVGVADPEDGGITPFEASVDLTADFGDGSTLGRISGRVHSVVDAEGQPLDPDPVLTLESTDIGNADSGFFTGTTAMTYGDDDLPYNGSWGGHFLGDGAAATGHPEGVVGTFGAASDRGTSLVGAFYANRQEEE